MTGDDEQQFEAHPLERDALSSAAGAAGQGMKPPADAEREELRERDGRSQT